MPKNAVERLQKIESDIQTVISIYDVASKSSGENAKKDKPQGRSAKMDNPTGIFDKIRKKSMHDQISACEGFRKDISSASPPSQDHFLIMSRKSWAAKKPGSAPASSITLSTISESDYFGQPLCDLDLLKDSKSSAEKVSQSKTVDDLSNLDWFVTDSSFPLLYEVFMSPSQTIQTAEEVLAKNNYRMSDDGNENEEKHGSHLKKGKESDYKAEPGKKNEGVEKLKPNAGKICLTLPKEKIVKEEEKKPIQNRTRSLSPRIENQKAKEYRWECYHPITSKSVATPKNRIDPKKEKSTSEISNMRCVIPKKIPRLEKQRPGSPELLSRKTCPTCVDSKDRKEKSNKNWCCLTTVEGENVKKLRPERPPSRDRNAPKEEAKDKSESKDKTESKIRNPSKFNFRSKRDDKTETEKIEPSNEKEEKPGSAPVCHPQRKPKQSENVDLRPHELFKIIEKSNEKLEKMKISKELALDIAKELKDKYEEIQHSKVDLMERLQKLEKDNERLNNEVRDAHESNIKLQLKMEGFHMDSRSMLIEQDHLNREVMDENAWLKCKLTEMGRHHREELLERQIQIDQIKKQRFMEEKSEAKREIQVERDVEKLVEENSKLLAKVEELRSFLDDRRSKVESLEEKLSQLQEEVQSQKQHLKQKTERLEDTNRELESIRKTSKDLEDQVKILRKNIENFDEMHQNLVKRTYEYEHQMKSQQEELKRIHEERDKLQRELDSERDSILIKNKIIEDQQETVKQLREKAEEAKSVLKKNQSLERILNIEREEKLELQEAVELLKWRKEELKKKIKTLESDLLLAPQDVVKDLQKTQIVLHELENQVQIKQKEWELHLQSLVREKEQACSVAEFATKKLMQTTNEFQKQSEAHKKLHRVLAENLAEKEKLLRGLNEKADQISMKTSDSQSWVADLKDRESVASIDNQQGAGTDDLDEKLNWLKKKASSHTWSSGRRVASPEPFSPSSFTQVRREIPTARSLLTPTESP